MDFEAILDEAHEAAKAAVDALGPEDMNVFDCGFAWVTLDGNEPLSRYCRNVLKKMNSVGYRELTAKRRYGDKAHPHGWQWWKPGGYSGQAIGHHEAGARAFRDVLAKYNIVCTTGSRYD